jgi:DNA invertase Pin-like site-specific DNA recombinase
MTMGGISGGTWAAGLKQLLADMGRGLIDIVVVYKVDRLSTVSWTSLRSSSFDNHSVSFVSVTQAFNTTNSMGG